MNTPSLETISYILLALSIINNAGTILNNINIIQNNASSLYSKISKLSKTQKFKDNFLILSILKHEILPLLAAGIVLNAIGFSLARQFPSVLFLDMIGTALVCIAAGPWMGSLIAIISATILHPLLVPDITNANNTVIPWVLVSVCGAIFWGYMCKLPFIRQYLYNSKLVFKDHIKVLFLLGGIGAAIMAAPGIYIQSIITAAPLAFDPTADKALYDLTNFMQQHAADGLGLWLVNTLRYLPDKIFTIGIAIILFKSMFPYLASRKANKATNSNTIDKINAHIPIAILAAFAWRTSLKPNFPPSQTLEYDTTNTLLLYFLISITLIAYAWGLLKIELCNDSRNKTLLIKSTLCKSKRFINQSPQFYCVGIIWPVLILISSTAVLTTIAMEPDNFGTLVGRYLGVIYGLAAIVYIIKSTASQYIATIS